MLCMIEIMTPFESPDSSKSIQNRINAAKEELNPRASSTDPATSAYLAWRMVIDLVTGVGVGVAVGYGLDSLFGITPILLSIFTLLGFAAGINLMLRTAKEYQSKNTN